MSDDIIQLLETFDEDVRDDIATAKETLQAIEEHYAEVARRRGQARDTRCAHYEVHDSNLIAVRIRRPQAAVSPSVRAREARTV